MKNEKEPFFSLVEKVVNKGPFPNAQSNIISRLLNVALFSCILPVIGLIYIRLKSVALINYEILPRQLYPEVIIIWIVVFLFSYTYLLYYASLRVKEFLLKIRGCVDYDESAFQVFERDIIGKIFNPSRSLLILLLVTVPFGTLGVISNIIYAGDHVTTILISLILIHSSFLNWIGSWMLLTFLATSNKFGRDVPLRVDSFDLDKVGGLAPLSDLSTLAIFGVGLLAMIAIPIWYLFFSIASFSLVFITSILIPCYFFYSMRGVYEKLREEKENSLGELNDELRLVTARIRNFIAINHERERFDERELTALGQTLSSINIIYERIRSMHTFPINSEIMIKVALSAVLPVFAIIADFLIAVYL